MTTTKNPGRTNRCINYISYSLNVFHGMELRYQPSGAINWFLRGGQEDSWQPLVEGGEGIASLLKAVGAKIDVVLKPEYE